MERLNITEGEWRTVEYPESAYISKHIAVEFSDDGECAAEWINTMDDATLICDAANTYQKKAILPSKMLEDRGKMVAAMKDFIQTDKEPGVMNVEYYSRVFEQLLKEVEDGGI